MVFKVQIGDLYITEEVTKVIPEEYVLKCLDRHLAGDWGELEEMEKGINERALKAGDGVLSQYNYGSSSFYILTLGISGKIIAMLKDEVLKKLGFPLAEI